MFGFDKQKVAQIRLKAIGVQRRPHFLRKLSVEAAMYRAIRSRIKTKGAMRTAAKACLAMNTKARYKVELAKGVADVARKKRMIANAMSRGALKGVRSRKLFHGEKAAAGLSGATAALRKVGGPVKWSIPKLKSQARRKAAAWVRSKGVCRSLGQILSSLPKIRKL